MFPKYILFLMLAFALSSCATTFSPTPTQTLIPTNTPAPTNTPKPTPTSTPTETQVPFVQSEACDLRILYNHNFNNKNIEAEWYLVKLIPYLRTFGYHGEDGSGVFGAKVDETKVILTLTYKKDLKSPQIALPEEIWGSLPTNRFCMVSGNWTPLSPFFGDIPIQ